MRIGKRKFASRKRKIAGLCAFVLAGVVGVGAYAFTASNTIQKQSAGAGTIAVGSYEEEGVYYEWDVAGTHNTAVDFILKGADAPTDVAVALTKEAEPKANSDWQDCVKSGKISAGKGAGEWEVECKFETPVENKTGDNLTVAAVSNGKVVIE